jgi:cytochrome c-type biogenesis protein CcmH
MNRRPARLRRRLGALALVFAGVTSAFPCGAAAPSVDAHGQLEDHALQARFETITKELRCLVCQNESIADSNVELASDLRRQVREMLIAGASDDAIFDFMTDRYGEFVRFNPPLERKTLLIWGAPFIALLLGGIIIFRVARHRSRMPLDD